MNNKREKCIHKCEEINTRCGIENKIIAINYQCIKCGKILTYDEWYEIKKENCKQCNGLGYHERQGEKINCTACKI